MVAKQQRGRDTVDRLLEAALTVYAEHGVERFTLKAVLETSGVSVGSAYHHFGSLEALAIELYRRGMSELLDVMCEALLPHDDPREGVRAVVAAYLKWCTEDRAQALVTHTLPFTGYFPGIMARISEGPDEKFSEFVGWFDRHTQAGQLRELSPQILEALVVGPLFVVVHRWLSKVPGMDIDEARRELPDSIWQSLRQA